MRKSLEAELTEDAAAALGRAGYSRRSFLAGAGAMVVSFTMGGALRAASGQERKPRLGDGNSPGSPPWELLDSWIAIAADGMVTAYTGKAELGQGQWTVQAQLVAEELCVPFSRVKVIACDTAMCPDQGLTSGSQSTLTNFNHKNLAQAAASAREALVRLASKQLEVPADQLIAKDGIVSAKGDPAKKLDYGQLIEGKKFEIKVDPKAKRKPATEWTVLGKPVQRTDLPAVVTGQMEYVHNVRLPGMLHGRVVRPPAFGATVVGVDESSVQGMPGMVKVVVKKNFVGVVAEKPWQAIQAAEKLKVTWTPGTGLPSQATYYDHLRKQQPTQDVLLVNSKDVDEKLNQGATLVKATYHYPNQMHGSMGTSCAVADVQDGKATLYSSTQAVWPMRRTSSIVMGLKPEDVHVIFRRGSGCYGINGADTVTYDAALLSQAVGKPVRVQLMRKDEMAWENFGFAFVMDERATLDASGNIAAWDYESWSADLGGRPGVSPGNVITGSLAGFPMTAFQPKTPAAEDPQEYSNLANGVPPYFAGNVGGKAYGTGVIKSERALSHNARSHLFTGPLRGPGRLQNTFAHESFMDELAARAKADPVDFRVRHLSEPRLIAVVKEAAALASWEARPSPKPRSSGIGVVTGRGLSCVAYEGDNGYSAMIADVEVNRGTGNVVVKRFHISVDCGPISNPDGLRNQIEGGALHGMNRAIAEEATWDNEKVTSIDWASYRPMPLSFAVPEIKIQSINRPDKDATGAGEFIIVLVAAAIGNAIFDATGVRIRQAPFTPERVKAALKAV